MSTCKVAGYDVSFPHQAYGPQLGYMYKVLKALDARSHALLESPTGSGKTLALLCSSLAWQARERDRMRAQAQVDLMAAGEEGEKAMRGKVPRIFYATRTHSQIAQVVRELKRTAYRPAMVILASKDNYCVHKVVSRKGANRNEECNALLADPELSCEFFHKAGKLSKHVSATSSLQVHDIEDLVKAGKKQRGCPYYAARLGLETAELIFCPYSYIMDPTVRRAMAIDIDDAVVIFDEAHNIEDISREAGGLELSAPQLIEARGRFLAAVEARVLPEVHRSLGLALDRIVNWLVDSANSTQVRKHTHDKYEGVWQGRDALLHLDKAGLSPAAVDELWECYLAARKSDEEAEPGDFKVGGIALGTVCRTLLTLALMYKGGPKRMEDYRLVVTKTMQRGRGTGSTWSGAGAGASAGSIGAVRQTAFRPPVVTQHPSTDGEAPTMAMAPEGGPSGMYGKLLGLKGRGGGRGGRGGRSGAGRGGRGGGSSSQGGDGGGSSVWVVELGLWLLNPAVTFGEVAGAARAVILTSGTLAPIESFASELGTSFDVQLEAPHVVDMKRQVWAGIIDAGPSRLPLNASYRTADTYDFQDQLGAVLLATCQVAPGGVLVFLPSYSLLDKLEARWKHTGLWAKLLQHKGCVGTEPRGTGDAFEKTMKTHYANIKAGKGAVFMAVFRGKVSEGLDFADDNARAVLIVGIPFPSVMDTKVQQKKAYNNAATSRGLLTGDQWYTQQAFRALNQAVGRCIRHRFDYGAILLVDERFKQERNLNYVSKWVRGSLRRPSNFAAAQHALQSFFTALRADPPMAPPPPPPPPPPPAKPRPLPLSTRPATAKPFRSPLMELNGPPAAAGVVARSLSPASMRMAAKKTWQGSPATLWDDCKFTGSVQILSATQKPPPAAVAHLKPDSRSPPQQLRHSPYFLCSASDESQEGVQATPGAHEQPTSPSLGRSASHQAHDRQNSPVGWTTAAERVSQNAKVVWAPAAAAAIAVRPEGATAVDDFDAFDEGGLGDEDYAAALAQWEGTAKDEATLAAAAAHEEAMRSWTLPALECAAEGEGWEDTNEWMPTQGMGTGIDEWDVTYTLDSQPYAARAVAPCPTSQAQRASLRGGADDSQPSPRGAGRAWGRPHMQVEYENDENVENGRRAWGDDIEGDSDDDFSKPARLRPLVRRNPSHAVAVRGGGQQQAGGHAHAAKKWRPTTL